jgi:hypothetical protein
MRGRYAASGHRHRRAEQGCELTDPLLCINDPILAQHGAPVRRGRLAARRDVYYAIPVISELGTEWLRNQMVGTCGVKP